MIVPYDYEEVTCTSGAANVLTEAKVLSMGNAKCMVQILVTAYPVAFREDGGTPTSATAQQAPINSVIKIKSRIGAGQFKAIGIGGSAVLAVTYFKRV
jgi:hypothetical protein